jgi:hypothetical protein
MIASKCCTLIDPSLSAAKENALVRPQQAPWLPYLPA